jgi:hypothetical protein
MVRIGRPRSVIVDNGCLDTRNWEGKGLPLYNCTVIAAKGRTYQQGLSIDLARAARLAGPCNFNTRCTQAGPGKKFTEVKTSLLGQ